MKEKLKKTMKIIAEKLKSMKTKVFSSGFFRNKKKQDNEILKVLKEEITIIDGVEIIDGDFDGELTSKVKMKRWKKVLLIIGGVIASLVVIVIITYVSLVNSGKKRLYASATSEKPSFRTSERETDENGEAIKELDMYIDEDGNIVVFEGTNENTSGTGNSSNTESGSNTENSSGVSGLKNHTVSFEGVSENSNYDIIFDGVKYAYNKDMITLLVLGIDKKDVVSPAQDGISGGQSDALFLIAMNPHTKIMDIIAIPRDSIALVDIYNKDGTYNRSGYAQVCLQHAYGDGMEISNERVKVAVSRMLYDLPIHSCTSINMGAIPSLNDAIGGVTLTSLYTFSTDNSYFEEGKTVTLMGETAYDYVHYRDTGRHYTALERIARQKQYLTLFVNQAISKAKQSLGVVIDVYNIISNYVVTDISIDKMAYLASEAVSYSFGNIYVLEGNIDTLRQFERYYLDQDALYELLIDKYYEKIE